MMHNFTLVIGNKNYSSWSLRPWLLMQYFNIPFSEKRIPLFTNETNASLEQWSPSGLVPALITDEITVWDTLAIGEYLNDRYPQHVMWPKDANARAIARSVSAEMHSGFSAIRNNMPMNCRQHYPGIATTADVDAEIKRIISIWKQCRDRYGASAAFLFGDFSIADAMFAPIVMRFKTYAVELDKICSDYSSAMMALPAMQKWIEAAKKEVEVLEHYELKGLGA